MTSAVAAALRQAGFTVFCDITGFDRTSRGKGWTIMSRRHVDGIGFREQARDLAQFFDVNTVMDRVARAGK